MLTSKMTQARDRQRELVLEVCSRLTPGAVTEEALCTALLVLRPGLNAERLPTVCASLIRGSETGAQMLRADLGKPIGDVLSVRLADIMSAAGLNTKEDRCGFIISLFELGYGRLYQEKLSPAALRRLALLSEEELAARLVELAQAQVEVSAYDWIKEAESALEPEAGDGEWDRELSKWSPEERRILQAASLYLFYEETNPDEANAAAEEIGQLAGGLDAGMEQLRQQAAAAGVGGDSTQELFETLKLILCVILCMAICTALGLGYCWVAEKLFLAIEPLLVTNFLETIGSLACYLWLPILQLIIAVGLLGIFEVKELLSSVFHSRTKVSTAIKADCEPAQEERTDPEREETAHQRHTDSDREHEDQHPNRVRA